MKDVVILFSGGLDSALLLKMALGNGIAPYCVLIDYGQKHIAELKAAIEMCQKLQVEYQIVELKKLDIKSKLTDGVEQYQGVSQWHVPARNFMFVGIAASIAESRNIPKIWYGANYEDREHLFPDCYQDWVYHVNKVLAVNGSLPIKLEAPLLGMDKPMIKKLAFIYGIDETEIFSGYGNS